MNPTHVLGAQSAFETVPAPGQFPFQARINLPFDGQPLCFSDGSPVQRIENSLHQALVVVKGFAEGRGIEPRRFQASPGFQGQFATMAVPSKGPGV